MRSSGGVGHHAISMLMTTNSTSPFLQPLFGVCTAMDAGKWAEAEPGQEGGPEGGCTLHQQFGKLPLFWGGLTLTAKSEVHRLGIHLDPVLTMETQVVSVVRSMCHGCEY